MSTQSIPLSVIGGFLGAGKTTLLNRILSQPAGVRYGVLVNDFGSIAVDERLVTRHQGDTISFANGCVCCSLGDNLVQSIDQLLQGDNCPQQFLVEASGVANPRAIADVATLHPDLRRDLTLVLVDAETVVERLSDTRLSDTIALQLQSADIVVINKCDLVEQVGRVREALVALRDVPMVASTHADIPLSILDAVQIAQAPVQDRVAASAHRPQQLFDTLSVAMDGVVTEHDLLRLLQADGVLRAKGFVNIQGRDGLSHVETVAARTTLSQWSGGDANRQQPVLVVIGLAGIFDSRDFSQGLDQALAKTA